MIADFEMKIRFSFYYAISCLLFTTELSLTTRRSQQLLFRRRLASTPPPSFAVAWPYRRRQKDDAFDTDAPLLWRLR